MSFAVGFEIGLAGSLAAGLGAGATFGTALTIGFGGGFFLEDVSLLPDDDDEDDSSFFESPGTFAGFGATLAATGFFLDELLSLLSEEELSLPLDEGFGPGFPPYSSQNESFESSESESSSSARVFFGGGLGFGAGAGDAACFGLGDIAGRVGSLKPESLPEELLLSDDAAGLGAAGFGPDEANLGFLSSLLLSLSLSESCKNDFFFGEGGLGFAAGAGASFGFGESGRRIGILNLEDSSLLLSLSLSESSSNDFFFGGGGLGFGAGADASFGFGDSGRRTGILNFEDSSLDELLSDDSTFFGAADFGLGGIFFFSLLLSLSLSESAKNDFFGAGGLAFGFGERGRRIGTLNFEDSSLDDDELLSEAATSFGAAAFGLGGATFLLLALPSESESNIDFFFGGGGAATLAAGFGESGLRILKPESEDELSSDEDESVFFFGSGLAAAGFGGAALGATFAASGLRIGNLKPESLSDDELSLSDRYPMVYLSRLQTPIDYTVYT